MDIRQLKYFLAVAEDGLITKAAKRLNITQSPLSQQMLLLEKECGVKLFQRSKKQMKLTEAGLVLKRRAEQILSLTKLAENEVKETAKGFQGKLTIGIINSSGNLFLPDVIQHFHKMYPLVSFDLRQYDSQKIQELLNTHIIDIGFVRFPINSNDFDCIKLPQENMLMVSNSENILKEVKENNIIDLREKPLLIHRRYETLIIDYFQKLDIEPKILCTSDEIVPLLTWAYRGLGVAILPEFAQNFLTNTSLFVKKVKEPVVTTTSALIWRKNETLPAVAKNFIECFRKSL